MKQIIWVVGSSSAGKQTFLQTIMASENQELKDKLGLHGKIAIVQRSIDFPGDTTMPTIVHEREQIPQDAALLLQNNDTVLIKWQYLDSRYDIPRKLRGAVLNAQHRAIWLTANENDSIERLNQKGWWKEKGFETARDIYRYEQEVADEYINELAPYFPITKIDSSNNAGYAIIQSSL